MKIIFTMLMVLGINTIAQTNKAGFIQLNLTMLESNTSVKVDCIDDKISYTDTSNKFTLVLHPNEEYILEFSKIGYITKQIYISTNKINEYNKYSIDVKVSLDKGYSNYSQLYGALVYDTKIDSFVKRKYGN